MHPLFAHFPVSLSLAALLLEVLYVVFRSGENSARGNTFKIVAAAAAISYGGRLVFTSSTRRVSRAIMRTQKLKVRNREHACYPFFRTDREQVSTPAEYGALAPGVQFLKIDHYTDCPNRPVDKLTQVHFGPPRRPFSYLRPSARNWS